MKRIGANSRVYKSKAGVKEKSDIINWKELARMAEEGAKRVEEKYGKYVELPEYNTRRVRRYL